MRKLFSLAALLVVLGFYSCDKVSNPIIDKGNNAVIPVVPPTHVDSTSSTDDTLLKVLVEDYTAHNCTNCPKAGSQCDALLKGANSNQLVMMQVNASSLAQGYPNGTFPSLPDTAFGVDYRTTAGNQWDALFINGDGNGMPGTMVDRLYFNGTAGGPNDLILNGVNVNTPFDSLIGVSPAASMHQKVKIHIVDSTYIPPASTVSMSITTTLVSPQAGVKYYLVVGLVEDSIFDWQDSVSNDIQYYLKRMTFRDAVNGSAGWGDSLMANTSPQTMHYVYASPNFRYNNAPITFPPQVPARLWNMAHMYVVAFVYQRTSGKNDYLVLQAQKLHL